jgi:hypothetical protein
LDAFAELPQISDVAYFVRDHVNMHGVEKRIVYILRSQTDPIQTRHRADEGHAQALALAQPRSMVTPWTIVRGRWAIEFPSEAEAVRFEKYVESGSGRAFTKRRFAVRHDA